MRCGKADRQSGSPKRLCSSALRPATCVPPAEPGGTDPRPPAPRVAVSAPAAAPRPGPGPGHCAWPRVPPAPGSAAASLLLPPRPVGVLREAAREVGARCPPFPREPPRPGRRWRAPGRASAGGGCLPGTLVSLGRKARINHSALPSGDTARKNTRIYRRCPGRRDKGRRKAAKCQRNSSFLSPPRNPIA